MTDTPHWQRIEVALARIEENLKEHMRRTELAERAIEMLDLDLRPMKAHVARVDGALKLLGVIAVITGIVASIAGIFF